MASMKMKDICLKIGSGATPRGGKETYTDFGISLIRSQNVLDFSFSYDGLAHINQQQADKLNNVTVETGDVLLNITGDSVARACIVDNDALPARVNQHVAIIRANEKLAVNSYILYFLQMSKPYLLQLAAGGATRNALTKGMIEELEIEVPPIEQQQKIVSLIDNIQRKIRDVELLYLLFSLTSVQSIITGAVQPKISQANLNKVPVAIPSKKELQTLDATIQPIFAQIRNLRDENEKLATTRDTLLPKLMSGELDVSTLDL